jgi:hypothetical protein
MNRGEDKLEHLITRCLDDECTADERQLLDSLTRGDAEVRALFEDTQRVDGCVGDTLRQTLGRSPDVIPIRASRIRFSRTMTVAAAACLAALFWFQPKPAAQGPGRQPQQAALGNSWFAAPTPQGDAVEPLPSAYERPELRVRGTQRDWIIVPGNEPGTYLVIEVDHVRTHVIAVHRDF